MRKPAGYEDTLRALGHELDEAGLKGIYIQETPKQLRVSAREAPSGRPKELSFLFADLQRMVDAAHARRSTGQPERTKAFTYENLLRVLGHDLDQRGCEAFFLSEWNGDEVRIQCREPATQRMTLIRIHRRSGLARALEEAYLRRTK